MSKLILTRHGQSIWNAENRFTGWVDVDLSEKGKEEAKKSGELISELNIKVDISYASYLKRAIETLTIILKTLNLSMKFNTAWELNERHYGSLTGLNKEETKKKIGEEQFKKYRRSWDVAPPLMAKDSNYLENFSPLSLFASFIEGLSPTLPASCFSEPILINPCKKVPVVKTTDLDDIFLLSPKITPFTFLFKTIKSSTEPSII